MIESVSITMLDEEGKAVDVGAPKMAAGSDRVVVADVSGVSVGTFTVTWTDQSATDGHTLSGSFAFRVGGSNVAPAAATVEGDRPAAWAVLTRWAAFLLLAPALGLLILRATDRRRRLIGLALIGALVATVLEVPLLAKFPPGDAETTGLRQALDAQPTGWWFRLLGLLLAVAAIWLVSRRDPGGRIAAACGLVALSGYALTSHAAGRASYSEIATGVSFLHNAAVAIWIGGLALVVFAPIADRSAELAAFAKRALPLFVIAVIAGLVNAGLIFPSIDSILDSDYGSVLIAKVVVVLVVLGLAAWHHRTVLRHGDPLPARLMTSMRIEVGLIAVAVLLASTMAMLAPPTSATDATASLVDYGEPTTDQLTEDQVYVRLVIDPAKAGENTLTAWATQGPAFYVENDVDAGTVKTVQAPPLTDVQLIRVTFTSLTHQIAPLEVELSGDGTGVFSGGGLTLPVQDWWRATVTVRRTGVADDAVAEMYLRLPDPNVSGWDAAESSVSGSDPQAEALWTQARDTLATQSFVTFRQNLAGGQGGVEILHQTWSNGAIELMTPSVTIIRSDGMRYLRDTGGEWMATDDSNPLGPQGWVQDLDGATNFQLGNIETIDGVQAQIVHYFVPAHDGLAPAFYTWWIDPVTGHVMREAMVSNQHYMVQYFDWTTAPHPIATPDV